MNSAQVELNEKPLRHVVMIKSNALHCDVIGCVINAGVAECIHREML